MQGWKKHLVLPMLITALAVPTAISAQSNLAYQENKSPSHYASWEKREHGKHSAHQAHQRQYMLLLAEKYTPDKVSEWKDVFAQREQLVTKWKTVREKQKMDPYLVEKKEQYKKYKAVLRQKLDNGEISKEQMKIMLAEWKEKHFPEKAKFDAKRRERRTAFRQARAAFDEAVTTGNEEAIRSVMPKLLAQEKAFNQYLAEKLNQQKN